MAKLKKIQSLLLCVCHVVCINILIILFAVYTVEKVVLSDLLKEFTCVASSWLSLGVQLGIPKEILFKIQKECPHSMEDCLLKMLSYWEDNDTPTWSMVIEALCRINKKLFAIKLSSKYCT